MLVKTYGSAVQGIDAIKIGVEVDIGKGAKAQLIGLPDNAVKESLTRIYAALKNSGYKFPRKGLIINMAPADLKKEGAAYDLTIALGILLASDQIEIDSLDHCLLMGELSLDGGLLPIKGSLPMAIQAKKDGFKQMILPASNAAEASMVQGIEVFGLRDLKEVVQFLEDEALCALDLRLCRAVCSRIVREYETLVNAAYACKLSHKLAAKLLGVV